MKSASQSGVKWQEKASASSQDYLIGAQETTKDQATLAAASKNIALAAITEAFSSGRWENALKRAGKAGWLAGIKEKGQNNYPTGVSAMSSRSKYETNSGRYDAARRAADSIARGAKGTNIARVTSVVQALRAVKTGK